MYFLRVPHRFDEFCNTVGLTEFCDQDCGQRMEFVETGSDKLLFSGWLIRHDKAWILAMCIGYVRQAMRPVVFTLLLSPDF